MLKRRALDVYSAKPNSRRIKIEGYAFAPLAAEHFASAEFCSARLGLFRRRLDDGFAAHGLLTPGGALAYYMWLSVGSEQGWAPWALGARINLPSDAGYIFDCKTAPDHRNKGLYTSALKHARWLCHQAQCKRVLIDVEPLNEAAVKAINSAGFREVGAIKVTRLGPLVRTVQGSDTSFGWKRAPYAF